MGANNEIKVHSFNFFVDGENLREAVVSHGIQAYDVSYLDQIVIGTNRTIDVASSSSSSLLTRRHRSCCYVTPPRAVQHERLYLSTWSYRPPIGEEENGKDDCSSSSSGEYTIFNFFISIIIVIFYF